MENNNYNHLEYLFLSESNAIEGVFDEDSLKQALIAWDYLIYQDKLTTGVILRTHKTLMLNQPLMPDQRGYFRKIPAWIGMREAPSADEVEKAISQWIVNANDVVSNGQKEPKPFLDKLIKEHHIRYEKIHPFVDGNGRTGRMFLNWQRLKVSLPILIIKNSEKQEYYKWFE